MRPHVAASPDPAWSAVDAGLRLANPRPIEHSWTDDVPGFTSGAPEPLDRFEAAVTFAIREASERRARPTGETSEPGRNADLT